MFTVTSAARDRLTQKLEKLGVAKHMALRFSRREGGWTLHPDSARENDTTFAHGGRFVLVMEPAVCAGMAERTLDVRSTDTGPKLTLR